MTALFHGFLGGPWWPRFVLFLYGHDWHDSHPMTKSLALRTVQWQHQQHPTTHEANGSEAEVPNAKTITPIVVPALLPDLSIGQKGQKGHSAAQCKDLTENQNETAMQFATPDWQLPVINTKDGNCCRERFQWSSILIGILFVMQWRKVETNELNTTWQVWNIRWNMLVVWHVLSLCTGLDRHIFIHSQSHRPGTGPGPVLIVLPLCPWCPGIKLWTQSKSIKRVWWDKPCKQSAKRYVKNINKLCKEISIFRYLISRTFFWRCAKQKVHWSKWSTARRQRFASKHFQTIEVTFEVTYCPFCFLVWSPWSHQFLFVRFTVVWSCSTDIFVSVPNLSKEKHTSGGVYCMLHLQVGV